MQTAAFDEASDQGRKLRYLTAHFRDLQGLRMALFWAALLVLTALARAGSFSRGHLAWAAFAATVAQFGWLYLSGRWYERHYGVVKEPEVSTPSGLISIMHSEARPKRTGNRRYGYNSGVFAVLLLIWALSAVPGLFLSHGMRPGLFAMLLGAYQVVPRCFYPIINAWPVFLRRILSAAALIAMIGIYFEYLFKRIDLWSWMTLQFSFLLLLDLYDHWLLNHLLQTDFAGEEQ